MAFEVARLTGWLPVLVRVVGRALATEADRTGQHMEVDLRSLRVAVQLLSQFGWQGDLLRPLGRLSSAQLSRALQIVPFYRMTSRQIALCRAWGLSTDRDAIIPLDAQITVSSENIDAVEAEIQALQSEGLVRMRGPDGRFELLGGRAAQVLYETAAREHLGRSVAEIPFHAEFEELVGSALVRSAIAYAVEQVGGGDLIGELWQPPAGQGSIKEALDEIDSEPTALASCECSLQSTSDALTELLSGLDGNLLLAGGSVAGAGDWAVGGSVWRLRRAVNAADIDEALMTSLDSCRRFESESNIRVTGVRAVLRDGDDGRLLIHSLAAPEAVSLVVSQFRDGDLKSALHTSDATVRAIERHGVVPSLDSLIADATNQRGFIQLLGGELARAESDFARALNERENWLFAWNLGVCRAAMGRHADAAEALTRAKLLAASVTGQILIYMVGWWRGGVVTFQLNSPDPQLLIETIDLQTELLDIAEDGDTRAAVERRLRDPSFVNVELATAVLTSVDEQRASVVLGAPDVEGDGTIS
jgi:hypothetical protein